MSGEMARVRLPIVGATREALETHFAARRMQVHDMGDLARRRPGSAQYQDLTLVVLPSDDQHLLRVIAWRGQERTVCFDHLVRSLGDDEVPDGQRFGDLAHRREYVELARMIHERLASGQPVDDSTVVARRDSLESEE